MSYFVLKQYNIEIVSTDCGATSNENCTYLTTSTTVTSGLCSYTICKCSTDVCRIRFDFMVNSFCPIFRPHFTYYQFSQTFTIAGPELGTTTATGTAAMTTQGPGIGDCLTDTFTIASPGNVGSPVICGVNSMQHSMPC